jgi:hypothetical protein
MKIMTTRKKAEYYCVGVRRNYEPTWRMVSKHTTRDEAQAQLDKMRGFTGNFNYDNADLRVVSRVEAKAEFGAQWEYKPIVHSSSKSQDVSGSVKKN